MFSIFTIRLVTNLPIDIIDTEYESYFVPQIGTFIPIGTKNFPTLLQLKVTSVMASLTYSPQVVSKTGEETGEDILTTTSSLAPTEIYGELVGVSEDIFQMFGSWLSDNFKQLPAPAEAISLARSIKADLDKYPTPEKLAASGLHPFIHFFNKSDLNEIAFVIKLYGAAYAKIATSKPQELSQHPN